MGRWKCIALFVRTRSTVSYVTWEHIFSGSCKERPFLLLILFCFIGKYKIGFVGLTPFKRSRPVSLQDVTRFYMQRIKSTNQRKIQRTIPVYNPLKPLRKVDVILYRYFQHCTIWLTPSHALNRSQSLNFSLSLYVDKRQFIDDRTRITYFFCITWVTDIGNRWALTQKYQTEKETTMSTFEPFIRNTLFRLSLLRI